MNARTGWIGPKRGLRMGDIRSVGPAARRPLTMGRAGAATAAGRPAANLDAAASLRFPRQGGRRLARFMSR